MTHGIAMVKSLRTRNRFSATSVDQLPHQLVAHLLFGHQLLLPIPDIDRTVLLPGLRRQPDGLQRLADDRARLPAAAARAAGARRPDGRVRPAPHRDRQGRRRAPLRPARHRRGGAAGDAPRAVRRGARPAAGVVRRRAGDGRASRSPTSPPSAPRRSAACRPTTIRRLARELAAADGGGGVRPARASRRRASGSVCQWAIHCLNILTGNLDRVGGAMFTEPAIDVVGTGLIGRGHHDAWRSRVRGAAGVRRRAAGVGAARGDRDARRGPGPRDADRRRQPGAVDAGRHAARRRARRRSTSWPPSTSTSTRRPGTPT